MKRLSLGSVLFAVLLVGACVYDYTPPVPEGGGMVVINGDILIGYMTDVRIGRSFEVGGESAGILAADAVYVEDSRGTVYRGVADENNRYQIDTRSADPSLQYRLVVEMGGSVYESAWEPVLVASHIDSITHVIDKQRENIGIYISTHADTENHYYRWIARQVWEYHAAVNALYFYVPSGGVLDGHTMETDTIVSYEGRVNQYFCWNAAEVSDQLLASTESMGENKLIDHLLYSMECHEQRTQSLYSVELIQEALSPEAYRFYEAVRNNSTNVGGLFSPQPSELRGNIRCRTDAGERVLGFISVTQPAVQRHYIDFNYFIFHRTSKWESLLGEQSVQRNNWKRAYFEGYLVTVPVLGDASISYNQFRWAYRKCVDCRLLGGTKTRPDWWPNDHR